MQKRKSQHSVENLEFNCSSCGAALPPSAEQKTIVCEFCGTENIVPEKIWKMLAARDRELVRNPPPVQPFTPFPSTLDDGQSEKGKPARVSIGLVLILVLVAGGILMYCLKSHQVLSDHPIHGNAPALVDAAAVVPSFAKADPEKTAMKIMAMVKERWKSGARVGSIGFYEVGMDGTIDVSRENDCSIAMTFYDTGSFETIVPGKTRIKDALLTIKIMNNTMSSHIGNLDVSSRNDLNVLDSFPGCDLKSLFKAAEEAGYPTEGYADISFPVVPYGLGEDYFRSDLTMYMDDELIDEAWEKIEKAGWNKKSFFSYYYTVAGFDRGGRPAYFSIKDCSPRSGASLREKIIYDHVLRQ